MRPIPTASALLLASAAVVVGLQNVSRATAPVEPTLASVPAETFSVDGMHSSALFRIKHLNASYFYGRLNDISGEILLDEDEPSKSTATITIMAGSVDTHSANRDKHIMSPDFLDAKQFPEITFVSTSVEREGAMWKMSGDLELHGTSQAISLDFEKTGEGPGMRGGTVAGFHTRFTIDRTEWGMDLMTDGPLGKEIELTISLEAKRP